MKFKLKFYKTLKSTHQIVETIKKKQTQAIVYKDNEPMYFVDCFDLQTEANVLMNSLVLCQQQALTDVIKIISKKNNVNLSIKKKPVFSRETGSEIIELNLPPLPEEWLT